MPRGRQAKAKINQVTETENENKEVNVTPFLHQEIISEILSYLPVESLLRCKCVCKLWCTIICEPKFIRNHLARAKSVRPLWGDNNDASGDKETFNMIRCQDGLVLEKSRLRNQYRIRNPATKQVLLLPDPDVQLKRTYMRMSYVPNIKDYKLFYFSWEKGSTLVGCQILAVATDLTWRSLNIPGLQKFSSNNAEVFPRACNDAFYVVRIVEAEFGDNEILWIDVETECFSIMKIPRGFFTNWTNVKPMQYNKKLSLATIVEEKLYVWVLEDHKRNKWDERKIDLPMTFLKDFPCASRIVVQGSRLFINGDHQHLVYDTDCKKFIYTTSTTSSTAPGKKILSYIRPSAVYLKGMQPQQANESNELDDSD